MAAPRIISLDLDDTLWPVAPVIAAAEIALLEWLRTHHPRAADGHDLCTMREIRDQVARRFPAHGHDLTFLRRRALEEQFAAAGYADPRAEESPVAHAMEIFHTERNRVMLYDDVRPALERLRPDHRLFALSNGNADLGRCGIAGLFDGHVSASKAGAAKPDPRIFAHLAALAGVPPREVLHIGDDPLADVVGAVRAGMQAVWLNRGGKRWPDGLGAPPRTIATLADIGRHHVRA
jgi:putative hydrolase of the HAD superfamily